MGRLLNALGLIIISVVAASSQEARRVAKAVVIPSEIYMSAVVAQPDCPVKIERALVAKMLDGSQKGFFQARNTGNKPIVFFQVAMWHSDNSGLNAIWPYRRTQSVVLPGELAPSEMNDGSIEFVPLTENLKDKLGLTGKMRRIVFFMVFKIEFQDGSVYDATPLLNSLEQHLTMFEEKYEKQKFPRPGKSGVRKLTTSLKSGDQNPR